MQKSSNVLSEKVCKKSSEKPGENVWKKVSKELIKKCARKEWAAKQAKTYTRPVAKNYAGKHTTAAAGKQSNKSA